MNFKFLSLAVLCASAPALAPMMPAVAEEPFELNRAQLDHVTAGNHRGGAANIVLKRGLTDSAPTWSPDTGDEVIVGFEQADPGQIVELTVATSGTERSSHDRFVNIEVSYPLPR